MKKIISSLIGLIATVVLVSSSAYAMFASTATVSGVTIQAGSADLEIGNGGDHQFTNNLNLAALGPVVVYPGISGTVPSEQDPFNLYNNSQGNFNLAVRAQIISWNGNANWGVLADSLSFRFRNVTDNHATSYHTLREWHDNGYDLPGDPIPFGSYPTNKKGYVVDYKISSTVGNELAGATLSNITVTFTGTQVNP